MHRKRHIRISGAGYAIAFFLAAACMVGAIDRHSAEVSLQVAMDMPRPVFEAQPLPLSAPCSFVQQDLGWGNGDRAPKCVNADLSTRKKK